MPGHLQAENSGAPMKPIIIVGTVIVHLALISYGIGIISEQIKHRVTRPILIFLGCGLFFDLTATVCMVMGSGRGFISQHGFLGYSCLLAMAVDSALVLRHRLKYGDLEVPRALHVLSRYAYVLWVLGAYITGGLLVFFRMSAR
jgi:hypothetical protein